MASRKRPRDANGELNGNSKPETPTNGLYDKIDAIDLQNGTTGSGANSNSSFENETYISLTDDNNLNSDTLSPDSSIKNSPRAVSRKSLFYLTEFVKLCFILSNENEIAKNIVNSSPKIKSEIRCIDWRCMCLS